MALGCYSLSSGDKSIVYQCNIASTLSIKDGAKYKVVRAMPTPPPKKKQTNKNKIKK